MCSCQRFLDGQTQKKMIGFGGGQLEQLRQCPGAGRRQASPEQAHEGRAGALPELRFDHAAAPATLARSEKSRTCSKSHGKLDPPWRSPDGPPCTGACWSDAARCGASISRAVAAASAPAPLRAAKSCLMRGSRLNRGGGENTENAPERSPGSATTRAAKNSRDLRTTSTHTAVGDAAVHLRCLAAWPSQGGRLSQALRVWLR